MATSGIFDQWDLDHLGPFPIPKSGNRYIFVGVERLSRLPVAFPTPDTTGMTTSHKIKNIISMFGVPSVLRVDFATSFQNEKVNRLCDTYNISLNFNAPYQPEWMGLVERSNSRIRYGLAKICDGNYDTWEDYLLEILLGIRSSRNRSTGKTPDELLYGIPLKTIGGEIFPTSNEVRVLELSGVRVERLETVNTAVPYKHCTTYDVGDLVLILNGRIRKKQPHNK
ncbi:Pro-Pol polyprotein [Zancudomyces culisetae]|uniref:Pro-Pol polyprotein n=1 Tax=Zancudomyces culisetae TaxID=1213189 RepID=A0A1R1PJH0_ZANCU|nr:Pro-Pol polyprotein [Zancudomyces culisetae]|eukprot:OMH81073.1 Pro-Pol polyprotein [Zancudomyces culisetae]